MDYLVLWIIVSLSRWSTDSIIQRLVQFHWFVDSLIHCFIESLGHWFIASLPHWFIVSLLHGLIDSLLQLFIDSLVHCFVASLLHHWFADSIHWFGCFVVCFNASFLHRFTGSLSLIHRFTGSLTSSISRAWIPSCPLFGISTTNCWFAHSLARLTISTLRCLCISKSFLYYRPSSSYSSFLFETSAPALAGHYW